MTTPTMTTPTIKSLAAAPALHQQIGTLGMFQKTLTAFMNFITETGKTPQITSNSHVPSTVTDAANAAIDSMNTDFASAQQVATGLQKQISSITDVISATQNFARHGHITMTSITATIDQYKKDGKSVDVPALTDQINLMISNIAELNTTVETAHTNTSTATTTLQGIDSDLNTDFQALQTAIPPVNGQMLNLGKLTEPEAFAKLQTDITGLNSQISDLQTAIAWETAGQVMIGVVGGAIALADVWNPVGWAVAGATVTGEVLLAGKKASDMTKLYTDQANLALTEDEQQILKPLYAIKNAITQIGTGVTQIEGITTQLESLHDQFKYAGDDVESFLKDVTENSSQQQIDGQSTYVLADYDGLETLCGSLLNPTPVKVLPAKSFLDAQNVAA